MFRFTIRDLLWLTLVAAVGCGWFLHVRSIRIAEENRAEELRQLAKSAVDEMNESIAKARRKGVPLPITPATLANP